MRRRIVVPLLVLFCIGFTVSCGSASTQTCSPITRDALDPASLTHVLPGAPPPSYLTDPPTSGAHQPAPPVSGVQDTPVAPPIQVGALEAGHVIIQYVGLTTSEVDELDELGSESVIVAPAEKLPDGTRVVATAWVTHQSCTGVDIAAMKKFISTRSGRGPGHP